MKVELKVKLSWWRKILIKIFGKSYINKGVKIYERNSCISK